MKIRVLHNFGCYEKGQVFEDWPGGMCELLIRRGLIEEVFDRQLEVATSEPEVERAEQPAWKPKRKK